MDKQYLVNKYGDFAVKFLKKIDIDEYTQYELDYFLSNNGELGVEVISQTFFNDLIFVNEWLNGENDGIVYPFVYKDEQDFIKNNVDFNKETVKSLFEEGPYWAIKRADHIKVLKEPSKSYIFN